MDTPTATCPICGLVYEIPSLGHSCLVRPPRRICDLRRAEALTAGQQGVVPAIPDSCDTETPRPRPGALRLALRRWLAAWDALDLKCAIDPDELEALGAEYRDASKALAAVVSPPQADGSILAARPDVEAIVEDAWTNENANALSRSVMALAAYIAQQDQALAESERSRLAYVESASGGEFEWLTGELATRTQQLEALTQLNDRNCADAQRVMSAGESAVGLALAMNDRLEVMKADRDAAVAECARLSKEREELRFALVTFLKRHPEDEKDLSVEAALLLARPGNESGV